MDKHSHLTLADVFRSGFNEYVHNSKAIPIEHYKIADAIMNCRTSALGGHLYQCEKCGHQVPVFNSCRNRHCPQCQAIARAKWVEQRNNELLPVPYYHIVFTVPEQLKPFALRNKSTFYNLLFKAVSGTLTDLAANPSYLGGTIGLITILHTWTQTLIDHPHIHCVMPAGALSEDGVEWKNSQRGFLFPIKVVKKVYRGKFMSFFKNAVTNGEIQFHGNLIDIKPRFKQMIDELYKTDWVVYMKESFSSPLTVIKYLGAYTNRIAISNSRIKAIDNGTVTFSYLDRRNGGRERCMTLSTGHFIQRFLLHVLPKGFVKIRYFGFMANRDRKVKVTMCHLSITAKMPGVELNKLKKKTQKETVYSELQLHNEKFCMCPICKEGKLILIEEIPKRAGPHWSRAA